MQSCTIWPLPATLSFPRLSLELYVQVVVETSVATMNASLTSRLLSLSVRPFVQLFLASVDDKEHNRVLYDAILIAGHGLKEKVSFHPRGTDTEPYGLPDLDCLIKRTTTALYKTKLGGLKSAGVQTCVQAIMLLAWHELALGLVR